MDSKTMTCMEFQFVWFGVLLVLYFILNEALNSKYVNIIYIYFIIYKEDFATVPSRK